MEELDVKNKYYTPTIEEFHVGFEFEKLCYEFTNLPDYCRGNSYYELVTKAKANEEGIEYNAEWRKVKANHNISDSVLWAYLSFKSKSKKDFTAEGNIRVKYLDTEDIESLGFESVFKEGDYPLMYEKNGHVLVHYSVTGTVIITDNVKTLFRGDIKNKSELVKLLIQLGIV